MPAGFGRYSQPPILTSLVCRPDYNLGSVNTRTAQALYPRSHGGRSISSMTSVGKPRQVLTIPAWAQWWGLALGCLVLYLTGASGYDLLTDDEIRHAEAGRRMIESGDWILPEY